MTRTIDEVHRIFKEKAVRAWHLQPETGEIPGIGATGPRPISAWWAQWLFPPQGIYQHFMMLTLSAFYRGQTPPWAIQEWDIELTVTNSGGNDTIEKRNFISTNIDPN